MDVNDRANPIHVKLPDGDANEFILRNGQKLSNDWIAERLAYHATNFTVQAWLSKKLKALRKIKSGEWMKDRSFDVSDSMYKDPNGVAYNLRMS